MSKKEKDEYSIALGMKIVEARKKNNISQKEMADRLNISPTRLNYWEKGKAKPDIKMVEGIASILNISISKLLGWDEFDSKCPNAGKRYKEFESFVLYLESLGYLVNWEVTKWHQEDVVENGVVVGQSSVEDDGYYIVTFPNSTTQATFTQEEFEVLQKQNKANIDGAILLQSQINKEKPSSAATDNGSSNENTVK